MPVRDGARHLDTAIASIVGQTLPDFEFLICDDGSVDETPDILRRWVAVDGRIRVLSTPPLGIVAALNAGFREARGSWIARMDADDIAEPERLERQILAVAAADQAVAAIGSAWHVMDAAGRVRELVTPPTQPQSIAAALLQHNCLAHPTMLIRRRAVIDVGGYRKAFKGAEDYDLWLRLTERHSLCALSEPLLRYREHPGQTAWVALEQRILAELGAKIAALARRAGLPDPAEGAETIDRPLLLKMGVQKSDIAEFTIRRAVEAAKHALGAGHADTARAALRLLWAQPNLKLRTRVHSALLLGRSFLAPMLKRA